MSLLSLRDEIKHTANKTRAEHMMAYFQTGKGGYGAEDVFVGLTVPQSRTIAKKFSDLPLLQIEELMISKVHEERLIALFILVQRFKKANPELRKEIFDFYFHHTKYVNNWDLVDASAGYIVGGYLWGNKDVLKVLTKLARSNDLWEKRIAIIATFEFIYHGEAETTLHIAEILLHDRHDLIHKAVGWMLREVGKRVSQETEEDFLRTRYKTMPRTTLRYAIERFPEERRLAYLKGNI
ncbi:MAG TPA: DNA alkylation repair protein [Patescibacteria group bacterium]|nr:DNA alkylation repair protein [Patescibacteria group bacterium]